MIETFLQQGAEEAKEVRWGSDAVDLPDPTAASDCRI